ncbi:MAG: FAD-binding protein [Chloroflexi bacterium]|nr:FAD-binding protein [Chloroflexota bacterium]
MHEFDNLIDTDVLVIGGGLAGTWAAVRAKDFPVDVTLVEKAMVARSGASTFAAGVMLAPQPDDDLDLWKKEIFERGDYLNDQDAVDVLLQDQIQRVSQMDGWGFPFERDASGQVVRTIGRAHKTTRILMFHGRKMMDGMRKQVVGKGVRLVERVMITDLLTSDGKYPTDGSIVGAMGFDVRSGETYLFRSKAVVMAAGYTSYRVGGGCCDNLAGDGVAATMRAGAQQLGLEFMTGCNITVWERRFHTAGINMMQGSGARIVNALGERFMPKYDPELAERTKTYYLCMAFCKEALEGRGPVYVDMRHLPPEAIQRFRRVIPKSMRIFDAAGIDIREKMVECSPSIRIGGSSSGSGGMRVDKDGRSSMPGLFGAGTATATLAHGTYSVGGVNLANCCVFGYRAGESAARTALEAAWPEVEAGGARRLLDAHLAPTRRDHGIEPDQVNEEIRRRLTPAQYNFFRHASRLEETTAWFEQLEQEKLPNLYARDVHEAVKAIELHNYVLVAKLALGAALVRTESRASHFREEFPYRDDDNWLKWLVVQETGDGTRIWTEDVPFERYSLKPPVRGKKPAPVQFFFV